MVIVVVLQIGIRSRILFLILIPILIFLSSVEHLLQNDAESAALKQEDALCFQ